MSVEQDRLQAVRQEPKIPEAGPALTMEDFEERGEMAFEAAWEREQEHDGHIDMRTAALYAVASRNLVDMAWAADVPHDPQRLLMLSHSFAAQAEAPEVARHTVHRSVACAMDRPSTGGKTSNGSRASTLNRRVSKVTRPRSSWRPRSKRPMRRRRADQSSEA